MSTEMNEGPSEGLFDLINQTAYQPGAVNPESGVSEGADSTLSGSGQEGLSPVVEPAPETPPVQAPDPSLTTQGQVAPAANQPPSPPYPPIDPAEVQQMQETIQNQARFIENVQMQRAREAEAAFERSLQDLSPEEAQAKRSERRALLLEHQNRTLVQRQQAEEANRQQQAKHLLAVNIAVDAGLPVSMASALMGARSLAEMEAKAQEVVADLQRYYQPIQPEVQQPQEPQVQQPQAATQEPQIDPYAAGGEAGTSHPVNEVEPGSGDLLGLIVQTRYAPA